MNFLLIYTKYCSILLTSQVCESYPICALLEFLPESLQKIQIDIFKNGALKLTVLRHPPPTPENLSRRQCCDGPRVQREILNSAPMMPRDASLSESYARLISKKKIAAVFPACPEATRSGIVIAILVNQSVYIFFCVFYCTFNFHCFLLGILFMKLYIYI